MSKKLKNVELTVNKISVNSNFSFVNDTNKHSHDEHWQDMPECVNNKRENCYAQIIFRFENEKDLKDFSTLIGQKLTQKTKSAWYPFKSHFGNGKKMIYVQK